MRSQPVVETAPAGGAALADVLIGTGAVTLVMAALIVLGLGHRSGRITVLARAGALLEWLTGLPARVAVPCAIALGAFVAAGLGFVWDVSLHIAQGRDEGPFGTPAHYFMLAGIMAFIAAGWLAVVMTGDERRPAWVRLATGWHAPPSAVVALGAAVFSLSGFPLDDVWHKLFGQDVTLWGPTHLMMISGGVFHFFALVMLVREARAGMASRPGPLHRALHASLRLVAATIALVGLTIAYQQEFAFGVPQFRLLLQPLMIAGTAAVVLVAARLVIGRGGALLTAFWSAATLGAITLIVGPVLGEPTHHFPLYFAEAALVEIAAAVTLPRRSRYAFGIVAGVLVGSAGVTAEWGWSHVWMPLAWPDHIVGEAIARSLPVAVAGGLVGAFVGAGLSRSPGPTVLGTGAWRVPATAIAVVVVSVLVLLPTKAPQLSGQLALTEAVGGPQRAVHATLRSDPGALDDADWLYAIAWQGGEHRRLAAPLERVAPGVYRTTEPIPVHGRWKAAIRLHRGAVMESVAVYMPADSAIPAPAIEARPELTRAFVADRRFMQRERRPDVPAWLFATGSALAMAMILALLSVLGWALVREARGGPRDMPACGRGVGARTVTA